jgi:adenylosuccinate synthase
MTKNISVVIGSAYGDEGKGLFTDYLSSLAENKENAVIRFNGGAQAGHTVTTPEGKRHVFGSLTSGSFNGSPCFFSSFFVFNPIVFMKEKREFETKSKCPPVRVNKNCYLSTPFDMILNQLIEIKRGNANHGSCGLGFGESIQRGENNKYTTNVGMLLNTKTLEQQLILIQKEYLYVRSQELGVQDILKDEYSFIFTDDFRQKIIDDFSLVTKEIEIVSDILPEEKNLIFEGAQGLLLDQHLGVFPHVTRSNTGLKNVISLINQYNENNSQTINSINVIYATRCYTTRHGSGPLKNPLLNKPYEKIVDNTNTPNQFQGTLRFAYLDLDVLADTIKRDIELANIPNNIKLNYKIGISCLDQTEKVNFYENDTLRELPSHEFSKYVSSKFNKDVLTSYSPTREKISLQSKAS